MPKAARTPKDAELQSVLGAAWSVWKSLLDELGERFDPLERVWRPSKSEFGRMCLLRHGRRTLLYLTPGAESVTAAIVLGERAVELALASRLPAAIKRRIGEARPYAEGRGIRFAVASARDVRTVLELVAFKTASK
jgi:hypothetical protein